MHDHERELVLDCAMERFWRRGYVNTKIDSIVSDTGVNRYAIYKAFSNKDGLFRAALTRYDERITAQIKTILDESPASPIRKLESAAEWLIGEFAVRRAGCLILDSSPHLQSQSGLMSIKIGYKKKMLQQFAGQFGAAKKIGQCKSPMSTKQLADILLVLCLGQGTLARIDPTVAKNASAVRVFFKVVDQMR